MDRGSWKGEAVNDLHPSPNDRPAPAADPPDEVLLELPRGGHGDPPGAPREQNRVAARSFKGTQFVDFRKMYLATDGRYLPTKIGMTIRAKELDAVIVALLRARRALGLPPATLKDLLAAHGGGDEDER